jgi:hypothetical protein
MSRLHVRFVSGGFIVEAFLSILRVFTMRASCDRLSFWKAGKRDGKRPAGRIAL